MRRLRNIIWILMMLCLMTAGLSYSAPVTHERKEGAYLVIEGRVSRITARMLVIEERMHPVSMYCRVFMENGTKSSLQTLANIGKIDLARIYVLRGKVERIIVLKNL